MLAVQSALLVTTPVGSREIQEPLRLSVRGDRQVVVRAVRAYKMLLRLRLKPKLNH